MLKSYSEKNEYMLSYFSPLLIQRPCFSSPLGLPPHRPAKDRRNLLFSSPQSHTVVPPSHESKNAPGVLLPYGLHVVYPLTSRRTPRVFFSHTSRLRTPRMYINLPFKYRTHQRTRDVDQRPADQYLHGGSGSREKSVHRIWIA